MQSIPGACRVSSLYPPTVHLDQAGASLPFPFELQHDVRSDQGRLISLSSSAQADDPVITILPRLLDHPLSRMMTASRIANDRRNLGGKHFDHAGDVRKRQAADVDLRQEALMAEQLALVEDLVDDLLRAADEDRAMRGGAFLIIGARDLLGAILRRRVGEKVAGIVWIKAVQGVLRIVPDVHVGG